MKVGIKTGPKSWDSETKALLEQYQIDCAEVWYRYDWEDRYQEMFATLKSHSVAFGLHYWGVVEGNILPSFCHSDTEQRRQGIASVKQSIDAAARVGARYVNIHPGSRVLTKLNPEFNQLSLVTVDPVSEDQATQLLLESVDEMHRYAAERNVLLLVETIPAHDASHWGEAEGRHTVLKTYHASMEMILAVARQGYYVTNDFGHTAASRPTTDRELVWQQLRQASEQLAPQTKLLHINTLSAPFNGTDSHDGILPTDWQAEVIPNEAQFIELLRLYADRDDVWAIPEPPEETMADNYLALQHYVEQLQANVVS